MGGPYGNPSLRGCFWSKSKSLSRHSTCISWIHLPESFRGSVQWPGFVVSLAAGTPNQVAIFRQLSWDEWEENDEAGQHRSEAETLFLYEGIRLIREIRCSGYAGAVRFSPATDLLYASGLNGLDILDPATTPRDARRIRLARCRG
jgi:hypothetical protein